MIEGLQQPAALLLVLCGVTGTALIPLLQFHQFGEPGQLARDGGLAYQLTFGLMLAAVSASYAVGSEIAGGTAAAALSKPVRRDLFLLGKFGGVARITFMFWYCLLGAILLAERVNERYATTDHSDWLVTDRYAQAALLLVGPAALLIAAILHHRRMARFAVAAWRALAGLLTLCVAGALALNRAGHWDPALAALDWRIVNVSLLVLAALLLFAAIATALATFLKPGVTLIVCLLLLGLGLAADTLLAPASAWFWRLLSRCVPNVQAFWLCDALAHGGRVPLGYTALTILYALAWCGLALGAGMLLFRRRDLN